MVKSMLARFGSISFRAGFFLAFFSYFAQKIFDLEYWKTTMLLVIEKNPSVAPEVLRQNPSAILSGLQVEEAFAGTPLPGYLQLSHQALNLGLFLCAIGILAGLFDTRKFVSSASKSLIYFGLFGLAGALIGARKADSTITGIIASRSIELDAFTLEVIKEMFSTILQELQMVSGAVFAFGIVLFLAVRFLAKPSISEIDVLRKYNTLERKYSRGEIDEEQYRVEREKIEKELERLESQPGEEP